MNIDQPECSISFCLWTDGILEKFLGSVTDVSFPSSSLTPPSPFFLLFFKPHAFVNLLYSWKGNDCYAGYFNCHLSNPFFVGSTGPLFDEEGQVLTHTILGSWEDFQQEAIKRGDIEVFNTFNTLCSSRKYPLPPPPQKVFWFEPSHPSRISSFASYFSLKILAFENPAPPTPPWNFQ